MRTHPAIIVGGLLQENPFFVPPDEFLQALRARGPISPKVAAASNRTKASSRRSAAIKNGSARSANLSSSGEM